MSLSTTILTDCEGRYPHGMRSVFRELVGSDSYDNYDVICVHTVDTRGRTLCIRQGTYTSGH